MQKMMQRPRSAVLAARWLAPHGWLCLLFVERRTTRLGMAPSTVGWTPQPLIRKDRWKTQIFYDL